MFERFTEHARSVLQLEGMEAQKMHHDHLGTEHLLLALMKEPQGHGHMALESLGATYKQLCAAVTDLVEVGSDTDIPDAFHQTPRAMHVMDMAVEEARARKHTHLGTEHLLLALLRESDGVAMKALNSLGLDADKVRQKVEGLIKAEE